MCYIIIAHKNTLIMSGTYLQQLGVWKIKKIKNLSQFRMTEFGTLEIVTDPEPKDKEEESSCPQSDNTPNGASEKPNHSNQAVKAAPHDEGQ